MVGTMGARTGWAPILRIDQGAAVSHKKKTDGKPAAQAAEEQQAETVREEVKAPEAGPETGVEAPPLTLEEQLAQSEAKAAEYLDGWQRARAELQNVKKRTEREREQLTEMIRGDLALMMLPVLDDLDLAIHNLPDDLAKHEWISGILLIHKKLAGQLQAMGIEEIEALGQPFDPALHEAVSQVPGGGAEPHPVVAVLRKGYRLHGKVIRAALLHVAA